MRRWGLLLPHTLGPKPKQKRRGESPGATSSVIATTDMLLWLDGYSVTIDEQDFKGRIMAER